MRATRIAEIMSRRMEYITPLGSADLQHILAASISRLANHVFTSRYLRFNCSEKNFNFIRPSSAWKNLAVHLIYTTKPNLNV
jgi:hypothetical protein